MSRFAFKSVSSESLVGDLALKRDILMFDKIFISNSAFKRSCKNTNLEFAVSSNLGINPVQKRWNLDQNLSDLELLEKAGIIEFDDNSSENPAKPIRSEGSFNSIVDRVSDDILDSIKHIISNYNPDDREYFNKIGSSLIMVSDRIARYQCELKSRTMGTSCYPILHDIKSFENMEATRKELILSFVFNKIPQPAGNVSWEQVLDFRSDPDTKAKYYALIDWVNRISKEFLDISEFEEHYLYLHHEYLNHFRLHKIKTTESALEILVNGAASTIESLCRLKFSDLTKGLFSLFKNDLSLSLAELEFKGREVAYIHKANSYFNKKLE